MEKIVVAGYVSPSLVDVYGSSSFTTWFCGCNLKCYYCYNWEIALLRNDCKSIDLEKLVDEVYRTKKLVEYFQATGGEPLLQTNGLIMLYNVVKNNVGLKTSLNSNLVLYDSLKILLEKVEIDHIATDIKHPFEETTGVDLNTAQLYWNNYIKSLSLAVDKGIFIELRLPFFNGLDMNSESHRITQVLNILNKSDDYIIVIHPLLGEPYVKPWCREWCVGRCNPKLENLELAKSWFIERGFNKVYLRI
ncbi:MAG: radical SAM protein [Desulfurococcaceae archaeon]